MGSGVGSGDSRVLGHCGGRGGKAMVVFDLCLSLNEAQLGWSIGCLKVEKAEERLEMSARGALNIWGRSLE